MRNKVFHRAGIILAVALLSGSACSFKIDAPPGQVLCKTDSDCLNGARCEFVDQDAAPVDIRVCCVTPGCAKHMSEDALMNAAVALGYVPDAAPDVTAASEAGRSPRTQISPDAGTGSDGAGQP